LAKIRMRKALTTPSVKVGRSILAETTATSEGSGLLRGFDLGTKRNPPEAEDHIAHTMFPPPV
jgi:hypothetical protein